MLALVLLCIFMFLGCYAAGYIPIACNYSPHHLRLVTLVGAGLLVGAALAIVIPEGVATIYGVQHSHGGNAHTKHTGSHQNIDNSIPDDRHLNQLNDPVAHPFQVDGGIAQPAAVQPLPAADQPKPLPPDSAQKAVHSFDDHDHEKSAVSLTNHGMIGLSLTMGFILMFLIDHLGTEARCRTCARPLFPLFQCICCRKQSGDMLLPTTLDEAMSGGSGGGNAVAALAEAEHSALTTTVGLVVHSLADGLAIGAAFSLTLDLTLILFIAIMLHKAPAAFGFVSFLLHSGLPRHAVKKYLFAFSLATPVGALLTYCFVATISYLSSQHGSSSMTYTGFALLLSGGTFLYVATAHILPHLTVEKSSAPSPSVTSTSSSGYHHHTEVKLKPKEIFAFVLGSIIPVAISFGHSH
nr:zinc transporter zip9 [Hymenolepis microstoma]